jgi:hypothetical protein
MKYALLIYNSEARFNALSEEEAETIMRGHYGLLETLQADGAFVDGQRLVDTPAATTLRQSGGRTEVIDGPFAETKEQLGGFYIIDCPDLDAAIRYASMIPQGDTGSVEIRPVYLD